MIYLCSYLHGCKYSMYLYVQYQLNTYMQFVLLWQAKQICWYPHYYHISMMFITFEYPFFILILIVRIQYDRENLII